jgi:hypothetical protein
MEHRIEENLIHEATKSNERVQEGFEMSREQASQITAELSKLNDAILHDKPIHIEDLEDLSKVAKGTKIDVGGEIMTLEEAENIPDLKMNVEIWKEMKEGKFDNISKLTRITPSVSKYLENVKGSIDLKSLTSAEGLILPATINRGLFLDSLTSAEGLTLPTTINGGLFLDNLTSAKGLTLPNIIYGDLRLKRLTSAEGLILPTYIGQDLYLDILPSAEGLILPNTIKGFLLLNRLTSSEKEELKKKYPQFSNKIR